MLLDGYGLSESAPTVKAFVKLKEGYSITEEEIMRYSAERLVAYKAPKEVDILAELPKSSVGKLLRRVLRDQERTKVII
ncbi:hypothetical protein [Bacillus sp. MRMR6]|uniref:AMP-binding enzyme n=1 Tax=Bacillus sp. MRMR6 TaxID=1928617 RepID=UPI0009513EA6|nr:hypothetical protein [Bacillus sp. MRMR6]OLS41850.1 hypothetical protein BTR25_00315 [Bacillus sp. MRMR6]